MNSFSSELVYHNDLSTTTSPLPGGDGVAQWVERRSRGRKTRGSNPVCVRSTRTICEGFSESKKFVLTRCRCTQPHVCIRTHKNDRSRTRVKDPVVLVRVRWIAETRKDPACTLYNELGLGSATLFQLAFLGESNPNFTREEFPFGSTSLQNTTTTNTKQIF